MSAVIGRPAGVAVLACGLVAMSIGAGSVAVGAAPDRGAVAGGGAITGAGLTAVSVAPKSSSAWALGEQSTATAESDYALRRVGSHWTKESIKVPSGTVQLLSIAAGSAKSAWIVGNTYSATDTTQTLVEHSTGSGFKAVKTTLGAGQLLAASASSPTNAWAVGDGRSVAGPFIAHWNGHVWKALAETTLVGDSFSHVSASSPTNVWFLGDGASSPVVGVWNGHKLITRAFTPPTGVTVNSIATAGPTSTWLAGQRTATSGEVQLFLDHWNGKSWKVVQAPHPAYHSSATAVTAAGARAYILGTGSSKNYQTAALFILRYSGGHWSTAHSVSPGKVHSLSSISTSTEYAAAVGSWSVRGQCGVTHPTPNLPLVESLTGTTFKQVTVAKVHAQTAHLRATPSRPDC